MDIQINIMSQSTLILIIALSGGAIYTLISLRINILNLFRTPKILLEKGKTSYLSIDGGWGDHIEFFDTNTNSNERKIWGHDGLATWNIRNGHILRSHADNKKQIKLWVISNVEWDRRVDDMFFADVKFLGLSTDTYTIDK